MSEENWSQKQAKRIEEQNRRDRERKESLEVRLGLEWGILLDAGISPRILTVLEKLIERIERLEGKKE